MFTPGSAHGSPPAAMFHHSRSREHSQSPSQLRLSSSANELLLRQQRQSSASPSGSAAVRSRLPSDGRRRNSAGAQFKSSKSGMNPRRRFSTAEDEAMGAGGSDVEDELHRSNYSPGVMSPGVMSPNMMASPHGIPPHVMSPHGIPPHVMSPQQHMHPTDEYGSPLYPRILAPVAFGTPATPTHFISPISTPPHMFSPPVYMPHSPVMVPVYQPHFYPHAPPMRPQRPQFVPVRMIPHPYMPPSSDASGNPGYQ